MKLRFLKTWSLFLLCMPALLLIASCGGGGGSTSGAPQPVPTTQTGKFVDAPVEGLEYISGDVVSGTVTGTTDAQGTFKYVQMPNEPAKEVIFKVGNLTIGSCIGKSIVTPVDLVGGNSLADARALNLVRFLLGIGDATDPSKLRIADSTRQAFSGTGLVLDLLNDVAVDSLIKVAFPAGTLPTAVAAQQHLSGSLNTLYGGLYELTVSGVGENGPISDRLSVTIDSAFNITGNYFAGNSPGLPLSGTLNPVTGTFSITLVQGIGGIGAINGITGVVTGTWVDATSRFQLAGAKQP